MSENKLFAIAIILGCLVLLSPIACTMHQDRVLLEAVKSGADPVAIKCAMSGGGTGSICPFIKAK